MKNRKIPIIILLVLITIAVLVLVFFGSKPNKSNELSLFPPVGVHCFDSFMEVAKNGYADGFHIPSFEFKNISYSRCASVVGFNQYEIEGVDNNGHKFYIHKNEGGMAASGSDSVYDLCYKQDGEIVTNEKKYNLNGKYITESGNCSWTEGFPSGTEQLSTYIYNPNNIIK